MKSDCKLWIPRYEREHCCERFGDSTLAFSHFVKTGKNNDKAKSLNWVISRKQNGVLTE